MNGTRRREIADALRAKPMTAMEISQQFGIPVRLALDDVEHIRRSVRSANQAGERFLVIPAKCSSCGFGFRGRRRLGAPSRCPRCKCERISEPEFSITR